MSARLDRGRPVGVTARLAELPPAARGRALPLEVYVVDKTGGHYERVKVRGDKAAPVDDVIAVLRACPDESDGCKPAGIERGCADWDHACSDGSPGCQWLDDDGKWVAAPQGVTLAPGRWRGPCIRKPSVEVFGGPSSFPGGGRGR